MATEKYDALRRSAVERNIDQAIQRVYRVYGTDLHAFFKRIQREAQAQAEAQSAAKQQAKTKEIERTTR